MGVSTGCSLKIQTHFFDLTSSPNRKHFNFKTAFNCYNMGLFSEVCNVFLGQLAWKWQVIKFQSPKKYIEKTDFTSLTGDNLTFPINFGHAAIQFLANMPIWACLTAQTVQKIQILACETTKMHCLQNLFLGLQTLMTRHFLAS